MGAAFGAQHPDLKSRYTMGFILDMFAEGYSARVLEVKDRANADEVLAFKVLRWTQDFRDASLRETAQQAIITEADLLTELQDLDSVVRLRGCGFVSSQEEYPSGGKIASVDDAGELMARSREYLSLGWRPYLTLEKVPLAHSLFMYLFMRPQNHDARVVRRLPTQYALELGIQYARMLTQVHQRGIVYPDAKPEHVYWDSRAQKLKVIDWNASWKQSEQQLTPLQIAQQRRFDILMCAGYVLYPALTGLDPKTLQPPVAQPSPRAAVEARGHSLSQLELNRDPSLAPHLKEILKRAVDPHSGYESAAEFLADLEACAARLGRPGGPGPEAPDKVRDAWLMARQAMDAVLRAQDELERAKNVLNFAASLNPEDRDIRRLYTETQRFLDHRILL